ncbi:hypothetical protein FVW20_07920, partial [Desulfovibrio oxamicus]|nr:hypothetical protein [Nitratidesulfovibrio oxamicus]
MITAITPPPDAVPAMGSLRVRTLHLAPDCTIAAVPPGTEAPVTPNGACPRASEPAMANGSDASAPDAVR